MCYERPNAARIEWLNILVSQPRLWYRSPFGYEVNIYETHSSCNSVRSYL